MSVNLQPVAFNAAHRRCLWRVDTGGGRWRVMQQHPKIIGSAEKKTGFR
jgi:hypothetical protein